MIVGIASAVSQLREIRERRTLIRMSFAVAMALCGAAMLDQLIELPAIGPSGTARTTAVLSAGAQSFLSGLLVGGIALFILPFVERAFDITTGMTLIELRDPKQPLLRELQQRAPGTYNHSLNVASIAESAAESIGADSLLTYVGCLYHDIGKMTKPEFFIENIQGRHNPHDDLSPSMSRLVVISHVKEGVSLAHRYKLPRVIIDGIEQHHGTSVIQYFYHRARMQEEGKEVDKVKVRQEDYRYPGPKPKTLEMGILMLADGIEAASRTIDKSKPGQIEGLVNELVREKIVDGQFDECAITLAQIAAIRRSFVFSLNNMLHGRIAYPKDEDRDHQPAGPLPAE
jgi:putative nucleotidyltransferase with HDIG domain